MKQNIIYIISMLFSVLFIYAGVGKLMEYDLFYAQMDVSPIFHSVASGVWILPIAEIIIAGMLVFPRTRKWGLLLSLITMILFTFYVFALIYFFKNLPCSCGGLFEKMSWKSHLIMNVCLSIIAFFGNYLSLRKTDQFNMEYRYSRASV